MSEEAPLPAWLRPHGPPWRAQDGAEAHANPWFALHDYAGVAPTGVEARYYMLAYRNWAVGVLPLHEDGTVTLVGQWRFPFRAYSVEMPEGGAPKAEDPAAGARRELREEAGLSAAVLTPVLTMQLSNASSDEVALCFLATGLTPAPREPDPTEDLGVVRVPFRAALQAAVLGQVQDSLTVATLLRAYHMAQEGGIDAALARAMLAPAT